MPRFYRVLRTFVDERFYEPELLMRAKVQYEPESQQGARSRMVMEVLRANTRYYLRQFAVGQPTATFEVRELNPATCYRFGLKNPTARVANLSSSEGIRLTPSGERPDHRFVFEYTCLDGCGRRVAHLTHEFDLEPWTSVRMELVSDEGDESLTMTEYFVEE